MKTEIIIKTTYKNVFKEDVVITEKREFDLNKLEDRFIVIREAIDNFQSGNYTSESICKPNLN